MLTLLPMTRIRITMVLATVFIAGGCASVHEQRCSPGEEYSVNSVMYFGAAKPVGMVTLEEWTEFLRASVTPHFPQGLTAWQASGQWKGADGGIVQEASFVLSLVHPDDERSEGAVRAIASEYKSRFNQEAVLRLKSHVCASF